MRTEGPSWLPSLPQGWSLARGRTVARLVQRPPSAGEGVVTAFRDGQVTLRSNRRIDGFTEAVQEIGYQGVRAGELVIHSMDGFAGAMGVSDSDGKMSPVVHIYSVPDDNPYYVAHALRIAAHSGFIQSLAKGIRERSTSFDKPTFKDMLLPRPPRAEQDAIVTYLDRETARIDTLIEEQQCLIEMLRERREATIRSALLSGLDDAETAPSGVELLGAVPKHWRMVPTRYLCRITTGSEDSGNATDDGDYPFYVRGREVLRIDHYSFEGEAVMTPGDGQGGTGKVFHYFDGKFEAHQRVYVFTDFRDVTGWYFYYFLSTFLRPVALAGSNTVTMESLRRPLLADFKVAVPPIGEQQRITAYLDDQTAKIDTLIVEAERFIELARERRSALITATVTGQVDVREKV
ncbi:restriction endonuclease subunit S [Nocardia amikacinitolerans]|uniref:restriction endonuclease subunit S n=1 Tax=Nocardia amikacinitolerans TaxID=756689 RepID=UPI0020A56F8A|nr:restriction endonuclease subunit S [Nocardia amikacinitolerans]MCP2290838.1 type I restriction enzyme, S subunit [Nocardia amikacinitolerans]